MAESKAMELDLDNEIQKTKREGILKCILTKGSNTMSLTLN